jgi:hypothetical protein
MKKLPWTLLGIALVLVLWLALALLNAEGQREEMLARACAGPLAKGVAAPQCAVLGQHWWQHLAYALTHVQS